MCVYFNRHARGFVFRIKKRENAVSSIANDVIFRQPLAIGAITLQVALVPLL